MANVTIESNSNIIAHFIWNVMNCVIDRVVRSFIRQDVRAVAGCVTDSFVRRLFAQWGTGWLHDAFFNRPALRRSRVEHQTEKRGAIPKALGHAGGEQPPTRVTELVEDEHEEDGDGVGDQQLQHQQRGADELVEVGLVDVPQQKQWGVLNETQHVVDSHAIPVLGLIDEVLVAELHLHCRPAEHVDASVEEGEQAKHDGGPHPRQCFFNVLREWWVALPEEDPGVQEENEEVKQNHRQDPQLQHRAEQNQDHHTGGYLEAPPQENAEISHGSDVYFIVIILDLDGEDVAAQRSIHNGQEGDHH